MAQEFLGCALAPRFLTDFRIKNIQRRLCARRSFSIMRRTVPKISSLEFPVCRNLITSKPNRATCCYRHDERRIRASLKQEPAAMGRWRPLFSGRAIYACLTTIEMDARGSGRRLTVALGLVLGVHRMTLGKRGLSRNLRDKVSGVSGLFSQTNLADCHGTSGRTRYFVLRS